MTAGHTFNAYCIRFAITENESSPHENSVKMKTIISLTLLALFCTVLAEGTKVKRVCKPNSHYYDGCNWCHCNSDGTSAACTKRYCPTTVSRPPQVCKPGCKFMDDCNTCQCSEDGTYAMCTLMVCDHQTVEAVN